MALGSTQSLIEMSTRNISWRVKAAGAQPYHLRVSIVLKSGSFNLLEPSGPVQGSTGITLPLRVHNSVIFSYLNVWLLNLRLLYVKDDHCARDVFYSQLNLTLSLRNILQSIRLKTQFFGFYWRRRCR